MEEAAADLIGYEAYVEDLYAFSILSAELYATAIKNSIHPTYSLHYGEPSSGYDALLYRGCHDEDSHDDDTDDWPSDCDEPIRIYHGLEDWCCNCLECTCDSRVCYDCGKTCGVENSWCGMLSRHYIDGY